MLGLSATLLSTTLFAQPIEPPRLGYLDQPAYVCDKLRRGPSKPYEPQPGDILLYSDANLAWRTLYALAGTGAPGHSGLVVRMPDGELGVLEAGYNDTLWNRITPIQRRLAEYKGHIWVRQRHCPLTAEQSELLTYFACACDGSRYSAIRLLGQLTIFRSRGPLRTYFMGRPHGLRNKYICSEAVLEALVFAGLLDEESTRPAATYPMDMFYDRSRNLYLNKHFRLAPDWEPPALWCREPSSICR